MQATSPQIEIKFPFGLFWRSPESGDLWYKSGHLEKAICSYSEGGSMAPSPRLVAALPCGEGTHFKGFYLKAVGFKDFSLKAEAKIWP